MIRRLILILSVLFFAFQCKATDSIQLPLELETTQIKLDSINVGEAYSTSIKFKNVSEARISITKVAGTCGCTTGEVSKTELSAGETGDVKLNYFAGKPGEQSYSLFILANDRIAGKVELQANPRLDYVIKPDSLMFRGHPNEIPTPMLAELYYFGDLNRIPELKNISAHSSDVDIDIIQEPDDKLLDSMKNVPTFERPALAKFRILPKKQFSDMPSNVTLDVCLAEGTSHRTIMATSSFVQIQPYKISPNPLVRRLTSTDGDYKVNEIIRIKPTDIDCGIQSVTLEKLILPPELQGRLSAEVISAKNGQFEVHLSGNYSGSPCKAKGSAKIKLQFDDMALEASVDFLFFIGE